MNENMVHLRNDIYNMSFRTHIIFTSKIGLALEIQQYHPYTGWSRINNSTLSPECAQRSTKSEPNSLLHEKCRGKSIVLNTHVKLLLQFPGITIMTLSISKISFLSKNIPATQVLRSQENIHQVYRFSSF